MLFNIVRHDLEIGIKSWLIKPWLQVTEAGGVVKATVRIGQSYKKCEMDCLAAGPRQAGSI